MLALTGCWSASSYAPPNEREYKAFSKPERVAIQGYNDHAMEPFITRDGRYLFFNNSNNPSVDTNLHYAERISDVNFQYKGEIAGANSSVLDGVPTMDSYGNFYFVSTRSYEKSLATIYRGRFARGNLTDLALVSGLSLNRLGSVNFDVEVSASGDTLYFVDGVFTGKPVPDKADLAIAVRKGNDFQRLPNTNQLLKNINTDALEYAACISADQLELFFTRAEKNRLTIYRAARKAVTEPFDLPERVTAITGWAEAATLSPDGRSLYYHQRDGDRFVIYRVIRQSQEN